MVVALEQGDLLQNIDYKFKLKMEMLYFYG